MKKIWQTWLSTCNALRIVAAAVGALAVLSPATAAQPAPAGLVILSPFLLGASNSNLANLNLSTLVPALPSIASAKATGIAADGASAAIALYPTTAKSSVTFTINNTGATLLPYATNFLTKAPAAGTPSLTVASASFITIGSTSYAPALVQGPLSGFSSSNSSTTVTAVQGSATSKAALSIVAPPLLLVHGLWGDASSLANLQQYLKSSYPTGRVQAICYSIYLAFDASTDPLTPTSGPPGCEQTSASSIAAAVTSALAALDASAIVGSRVDVVAHSMGGLAARHYAGLSGYGSTRNRSLGQFHEIITLDTPETGSLLAPYLIANQNSTRKASLSSSAGKIWGSECGDASNVTVAQCFNANGMPIGPTGYSYTLGAVYSLEPTSPSLTSNTLVSPNIPNAIWRAVSAVAPSNSAIEWGINQLIAALYTSPSAAPTVNSLLGNLPNDSVVAVPSQIAGASAAHQYVTFTNPALSHTQLDGNAAEIFLLGLNNNSVVSDPTNSVNKLVACWLAQASAADGGASCVTAAKQSAARVAATSTSAATVEAPSGAANLKTVDRLSVTIQEPNDFTLGQPATIALHSGSLSLLRGLYVSQTDQTGHHTAQQPLSVTSSTGGTAIVTLTPQLLGAVTFTLNAAFSDGGIEKKQFTLSVDPPTASPQSFDADENNKPIALTLPAGDNAIATAGSMYILHPQATFAGLDHPVRLDSRFVTYDLVTGAGVVSLQPNGVVHAIGRGTATIDVRFGSTLDRVQVIVRDAP